MIFACSSKFTVVICFYSLVVVLFVVCNLNLFFRIRLLTDLVAGSLRTWIIGRIFLNVEDDLTFLTVIALLLKSFL